MPSIALLENDPNSNLPGAADASLLLPPPCPDHQRLRCQALLLDELTPCNARNTSGRFCSSHGREYKELTKAYKDVSKIAAGLGAHAALEEPQIRALRTVAEVDQAIATARAWRNAVVDEMRRRRAHHKRFFDTKDDGHECWIKGLANYQKKAERLIERLDEKREYLLKSSIPDDAIPVPVLGHIPVPIPSTTVHAPYAARPPSSARAVPTHDSRREFGPASPVRVNHAGGPLLPTHIIPRDRAPLPSSNSAQSSTRPLTTAPGPRYGCGYGAVVNCANPQAQADAGRPYAWRTFPHAMPSRTPLPYTYPSYSPNQENPNSDGGDKPGRSFLQKLLKGVMLVAPLVWLGYRLLW